MAIDITEKLLQSGTKYRRELLAMPIASLDKYMPYLTMRVGVRGKEVVGEIGGNAQLRPYQTAKNATDTTTLGLRELETFLGDVVEEFDPLQLASTVYGNAISTKLENFDIVKAAALEMAKSVGGKLGQNLFKAKRNAAGITTADLFNGFSTIADTEITAGNITAAKKNYVDLGAITPANVLDVIKASYRGLSEELREQNSLLYMPYEIFDMYNDAFAAEFGPVSYNDNFTQSFVIGSDRRCKLVPMSAIAGTGKMFLSTKENMLFGCDQLSDKEKVEIRRCDNPKVVQFFMTMYTGVQFESIDARRLKVCSYSLNAGA